MTQFFQFEKDFIDSLRCIPMQVRMKLDTCGIKLKLSHWHQFNQQERQLLVEMPASTTEQSQAYREYLQNLVTHYTGHPASKLTIDPNPAWLNRTMIPEDVQKKAQEFDISVTLDQWQSLTPAQRFALIKLSRSSHENRNFLPALKEFEII